jgi:hypothetical protein
VLENVGALAAPRQAAAPMVAPNDGSADGLQIPSVNVTMRDGSSLLTLVQSSRDEVTCAIIPDGGEECVLEHFGFGDEGDSECVQATVYFLIRSFLRCLRVCFL